MSKLVWTAGAGGVAVAGAVALALVLTEPSLPPAEPDAPAAEPARAAEPAPEAQARPAEQSAREGSVERAPMDDMATDPAPEAHAALPEPAPTPELPDRGGSGAPVFDLVRVELDGTALVAGGGLPGAQIDILLDGAPLAEALIGRDGKFVGFVDLPPADAPRVMSLLQRQGDEAIASEEEVIIGAFTASEAMQADPEQVTGAAGEAAASEPADQGAETKVVADPGPGLPEPEAVASLRQDLAEETAQVPSGAGVALPDITSVTPEPAGAAPEDPAAPAPARAGQSAPAPQAATASPQRDGEPARAAPVAQQAAVSDTPQAGRDAPQVADASVPAPPAILLNAPRGVEVLQAAPLAPGRVALDAIRYNAEGDVLLSGRGTEARFVRIYLDNAPITTSRIRADGRWSVELPQIDTGTYTLRVDQIDAEGSVIARVESPFLRENPSVLEAAAAQAAGPLTSITVQPGNTLWAIARDRYGEGIAYFKVFRANRDRIRDPDLIYPGQIFDLPDG